MQTGTPGEWCPFLAGGCMGGTEGRPRWRDTQRRPERKRCHRSYRCTRRCCDWTRSRSRRRGPCAGRRGGAACTARPAAWRRRGSSRSRPTRGSRRAGSAARVRTRTGCIARCSPGRSRAAGRGARSAPGGGALGPPSVLLPPRRCPALTWLQSATRSTTAAAATWDMVMRWLARGAEVGAWARWAAGVSGAVGRGGCRLWGRGDLLSAGEVVATLGVALAASSELGRAAVWGCGARPAFYTLPAARRANGLNGVPHKQGHSSHSSPPSCPINSHRIDPDPLTLSIPPSEKAGTLQLARKKKAQYFQHQIGVFSYALLLLSSSDFCRLKSHQQLLLSLLSLSLSFFYLFSF